MRKRVKGGEGLYEFLAYVTVVSIPVYIALNDRMMTE
jgi:hypothetical protein